MSSHLRKDEQIQQQRSNRQREGSKELIGSFVVLRVKYNVKCGEERRVFSHHDALTAAIAFGKYLNEHYSTRIF